MPSKKFEELHAYVHFNDNSTVKTKSDPKYDRAHKVRPVLHHFNEFFLKAMSPTMYQSIDEHKIKFKEYNIVRQYVKKNQCNGCLNCGVVVMLSVDICFSLIYTRGKKSAILNTV